MAEICGPGIRRRSPEAEAGSSERVTGPDSQREQAGMMHSIGGSSPFEWQWIRP